MYVYICVYMCMYVSSFLNSPKKLYFQFEKKKRQRKKLITSLPPWTGSSRPLLVFPSAYKSCKDTCSQGITESLLHSKERMHSRMDFCAVSFVVDESQVVWHSFY